MSKVELFQINRSVRENLWSFLPIEITFPNINENGKEIY